MALAIGSSCNIECGDGHAPIGGGTNGAKYTCSADTGLVAPKFSCDHAPCTVPSTPLNPSLLYVTCKAGLSLNNGQSCTLRCRDGFANTSPFNGYTCGQKGKLTPTTQTCNCVVPQFGKAVVSGANPATACKAGQTMPSGVSCEIRCQDGFNSNSQSDVGLYSCDPTQGLILPKFFCSERQYDRYVQAHNTLRTSAGLPKLGYSSLLEKQAVTKANSLAAGGCALSKTSAEQLNRISFETGFGAGEIIADGSLGATWATLVNSWWAEYSSGGTTFYRYGAYGATCTALPGTTVSKFTQVAWTCTTLVGCARATCSTGSTEVFVCMYGPAGNSPGYLPFTETVARNLKLDPKICGDGRGTRPACDASEAPSFVPTPSPTIPQSFTPAPVATAVPTPPDVVVETCARNKACFDFDYVCERCCAGGTSLSGYACFDKHFYTVESCCLNSQALPVSLFLTMSGTVEEFSTPILSIVRDFIAASVGISPNQMSVGVESGGSVVLRVNLPSSASTTLVNMVNSGQIRQIAGRLVEGISADVPATAAPVSTFGYSEFDVCAKEPACFDALYTCASCCSTGFTSPGTGSWSCWNAIYNENVCCNSQSGTPAPSQPYLYTAPETAVPVGVETCMKDWTCFDEVYTCSACCTTGVATDGSNCWDSSFTPSRCCSTQSQQAQIQTPGQQLLTPTIVQGQCVEKDPNCFNERYTCQSCCTTGKNVEDQPCWFAGYTQTRCCGNVLSIATTNAPVFFQQPVFTPVFQPPVFQPPVFQPPVFQPPAFQPPVFQPPTNFGCVDNYPTLCPQWAAIGQCAINSVVQQNCPIACGTCVGRRSEPAAIDYDSRGHPSVLGVRYSFSEDGKKLIDSRGHTTPDAETFFSQKRPASSDSSSLGLALGLGGAGVAILVAAIAVFVGIKKYKSAPSEGTTQSEGNAEVEMM